jgi:hypothetical protein
VPAGSGRVKLGEKIIELQALDALRVSPGVLRAFEAGLNGPAGEGTFVNGRSPSRSRRA